jgi:drug/metabolite transporter (DMT)-like permease
MASLVVASLVYMPFVPAHWPVRFSVSATISVVALALFCTVLAFQLLFALVSDVGPARATVVTYINPAVAAFLGIVLLNEPFSWGIVFGLALIVTGSYLATKHAAHQ